MSKPETTNVSAGRRIEAEIGWCQETREYVGTLSYPPDGVNAWIIMHDECSPSLEAARAALREAIQLPFWSCRYCSDWVLAQAGDTFMRNGVCRVCEGTKFIANTALPDIDRLMEEINNS
jgi:hypothetical protein